MRATIVIPSYWGRSGAEMPNPKDAVYDHPTPLDAPGTLGRALGSIAELENREFNVVVLAVATSPEIAEAVEEKVKSIVAPYRRHFPVTCLSYSFMRRLESRLAEEAESTGGENLTWMVSLLGYSNIRNMCVIAAQLARSEVAVLFDDDEVYEDHGYLDKVFENIGGEHEGKFVGAIAGYYLRPEGGYLLPLSKDWWMAEWPAVVTMNQAFSIIGEGPRLQVTPFVFGGNMIIHRDVFHRIPFDPNVRRGEDIDYLVNCKFFGIDFLLDRELSILHLPPEKTAPDWRRLREDIYRFIYQRAKLRAQVPVEGLRTVTVEELDPYPGRFTRDDLEEMIFRTSVLMGLRHMEMKDKLGFDESLNNIYLARFDASPKTDPFRWFLDYQVHWKGLMEFLGKDRVLSEELLGSM